MTPTLWWLPGSHYNEKAVWYLEHRGIEHERRAIPPFVHTGVAAVLTRGRSATFPILRMDGGTYPSSAALIDALETRYGASDLLPAGHADEILAAQAFFDDGVGVDARYVLHSHNVRDGAAVDRLLPPQARNPVGRAIARNGLSLRLGIGKAGGEERAWQGVLDTLDWIEARLDGGEYLVGGRFTLADLTGAALLYPLTLPKGSPRGLRHTDSLRELMAGVADRPAVRWTHQVYARHR